MHSQLSKTKTMIKLKPHQAAKYININDTDVKSTLIHAVSRDKERFLRQRWGRGEEKRRRRQIRKDGHKSRQDS